MELKFRLFDTNSKIMYSDVIVGNYKGEPTFPAVKLGGEWCYTNKETSRVMQYTGLKDCNGKEIYEGDIIKCEYVREGYDDTEEVTEIFVIGDFKKYATHIKKIPSSISEVIGNIYENPELLKGDE